MMLKLSVLKDILAVCRMSRGEPVPPWINYNSFFSITGTEDELSIIVPESDVPDEIDGTDSEAVILCEKGWRAFKVEGPLDFSLTGILSSLAVPLAEGGVGIFAVSTYDTDYILVKSEQLTKSIDILKKFCSVRIL